MSDVSTLAQGLGLTEAQLAQLTANLATLRSSKLLELDSDVARVKEGARITQAGLDLIAKGNTGATIEFTRVALGDALQSNVIQTPTDEEILSMTNVIHQKQSIPKMADAQFTGGGTFTIKFQLNNADYTEGFWCREIGLFAKDPDTKKEILYCYKNNGVLSTYVPAGDGAIAMNLIVSLITIVDQTTNVRATISADFQFVTQADLLNHINDKNPHPSLPIVKSEMTSSAYFWAAGSDKQLHPMSKSNLQVDILGDSIYALPNLSSRIGQNEMNIANLYSQLKAQAETGLDANLLLVEDFTDYNCIDTFQVDVPVQVRDVHNLYVSSFAGIREGSYYTVSDGLHSQTLQVKSLASNADKKAVIFTENLNTNFDLNKTKLYRTTCSMSDGYITGAGGEKIRRYDFSSDEWAGEAAGVPQSLRTLITETSTNYTKGAGKNGKYADFTLDGLFTLTAN